MYSKIQVIVKWNMKRGISVAVCEIVTGYSNDEEVIR